MLKQLIELLFLLHKNEFDGSYKCYKAYKGNKYPNSAFIIALMKFEIPAIGVGNNDDKCNKK